MCLVVVLSGMSPIGTPGVDLLKVNVLKVNWVHLSLFSCTNYPTVHPG